MITTKLIKNYKPSLLSFILKTDIQIEDFYSSVHSKFAIQILKIRHSISQCVSIYN